MMITAPVRYFLRRMISAICRRSASDISEKKEISLSFSRGAFVACGLPCVVYVQTIRTTSTPTQDTRGRVDFLLFLAEKVEVET